MYLERMIGRSMESEQFRQFKAMGGWKELQDSVSTQFNLCIMDFNTLGLPTNCLVVSQVNTFGANNPLTNLVPSLQDVDPDDAFSSVPYEKGFALLYHLEELLGGPGNVSLHHHNI